MERIVVNAHVIGAFAAVAWSFSELGATDTFVYVGFMAVALGGIAGTIFLGRQALELWADWRRRPKRRRPASF